MLWHDSALIFLNSISFVYTQVYLIIIMDKEQLDRIEKKLDKLNRKLDTHIREIWSVYEFIKKILEKLEKFKLW